MVLEAVGFAWDLILMLPMFTRRERRLMRSKKAPRLW